MATTTRNNAEQVLTNGAFDVSMHVSSIYIQTGVLERRPAWELELLASHTTDPGHLDPSCPDCRHLCEQLQVIASTAVTRIGPSAGNGVFFEIFSNADEIVCSASERQRPCVSVRIIVLNRLNDSGSNASAAISRLKDVLMDLGVRDR